MRALLFISCCVPLAAGECVCSRITPLSYRPNETLVPTSSGSALWFGSCVNVCALICITIARRESSTSIRNNTHQSWMQLKRTRSTERTKQNEQFKYSVAELVAERLWTPSMRSLNIFFFSFFHRFSLVVERALHTRDIVRAHSVFTFSDRGKTPPFYYYFPNWRSALRTTSSFYFIALFQYVMCSACVRSLEPATYERTNHTEKQHTKKRGERERKRK